MSDTPNPSPTSGPVDPVAAAKARRRIPFWAVALFPALLVWAVIYVNGVTEPPAEANTPQAMGAQIYGASCGGCHGANGEGSGATPAFAGGEIPELFPEWEEMIRWVDLGSSNWTSVTGSDTYGATEKPADPGGGMPGFGPGGSDGSLSCEEIALVVLHERDLAGIEPEEDLAELTEQIAAGQTPDEIPGCEAA